MKNTIQASTSSMRPKAQAGVSLIELMIAIVIAGLISLGLVQIFGASSATSQMTEGLSRVQESGRFATQYLQRQLRMVGFMGCGADTGRTVQESFVNHLAQYDAAVPGGNNVPGGNAYRFQRPIEAFTQGSMTATAELATITGLVDGSDVLIVRVFTEESTPVVSVSKATDTLNILVGDPDAPFLPEPNKRVLFGLENCRSADVFAGLLNGNAPGSLVIADGRASPNVYLDPSVSACGTAPCPWDFRISNAFLNAKPLVGDSSLNAEVHRAEYYAFFVRTNPNGIPSLHMLRFERDSFALGGPEELVEGVENMQLRFGIDTNTPPDGRVDVYQTAADIVGGAATPLALDAAWSRVLSVRIGMLIRSPDRAGAPDRTHTILDTSVTPSANDGAIREVYETTVALRNRLFKS
ncbi:PilW family protein [Dokdonella sp.]|uniref:PilW family protein n=1 Tax=Dokdonella sp. TaxID=2291710 RepID=UPI0035276197